MLLYVSIIHSFLLLCFISLYKYNTISISLSVDKHMGCSKFLAITKRAAINICVQVFVDNIFSYLLGKYIGVELLGHRVGVCLVF